MKKDLGKKIIVWIIVFSLIGTVILPFLAGNIQPTSNPVDQQIEIGDEEIGGVQDDEVEENSQKSETMPEGETKS